MRVIGVMKVNLRIKVAFVFFVAIILLLAIFLSDKFEKKQVNVNKETNEQRVERIRKSLPVTEPAQKNYPQPKGGNVAEYNRLYNLSLQAKQANNIPAAKNYAVQASNESQSFTTEQRRQVDDITTKEDQLFEIRISK
jgi:type I restriction-modification system DNA methylase subunit